MGIAEAWDSSGRRTHLCTGFGLVRAAVSTLRSRKKNLGPAPPGPKVFFFYSGHGDPKSFFI